jgi:hypothetical protein
MEYFEVFLLILALLGGFYLLIPTIVFVMTCGPSFFRTYRETYKDKSTDG